MRTVALALTALWTSIVPPAQAEPVCSVAKAAILHCDPLAPANIEKIIEWVKRQLGPPAVPPPQDGVVLTKIGNSYMLKASVNVGGPNRGGGDRSVNFVLDSGADLVCLPTAMVDDMIRRSELRQNEIHFSRFSNANGRTQISRRFELWEMHLDGYIITDVPATDGCAEPLLGQSFLNRFHSYSIDNDRQALILIWR